MTVHTMHQGDEHGEKSRHGPARSEDSDHVENTSALKKPSHDAAEPGSSDMPPLRDPNNPLNWTQWKASLSEVSSMYEKTRSNSSYRKISICS